MRTSYLPGLPEKEPYGRSLEFEEKDRGGDRKSGVMGKISRLTNLPDTLKHDVPL